MPLCVAASNRRARLHPDDAAPSYVQIRATPCESGRIIDSRTRAPGRRAAPACASSPRRCSVGSAARTRRDERGGWVSRRDIRGRLVFDHAFARRR